MASIQSYVAGHWPEWIGITLVAVFTWLALHLVAKPLLEFWEDRRKTLEAVQEHGGIGWLASKERVDEGAEALRAAAAKMMFYAHGGPFIVRLYCKLRGFDPHMAGRALTGLHDITGEAVHDELRHNNADLVRLCLGACGLMTIQRRNDLRRMIKESGDLA